MNKKLSALISIALLAAMLLGACAAPAAGISPRGAEGRGDVAPFDALEYVRPDAAAMAARVEELEGLLAAGAGAEDAAPLLEACIDDYNGAVSMYNLARIRYFADMTDEYYEREYAACADVIYSFDQAVERLYTACARSPVAGELERAYFWEGFAEEYGGDDAARYTDEVVALYQREGELLGEYYALIAAPEIVIDGVTVDYREYLAAADAQDYARAVEEYTRQYNSRLGNIYISLIRVRRELAEKLGYDSYEQMQYEAFARDYTPAQAEALLRDICEYIVPDSYAAAQMEVIAGAEYYPMSEGRLLDAVGTAAARIGGLADEAYSRMREYGYYDVALRANKSEMSFTSFLYAAEMPFVFVAPYGDTEDILTLAHEFGHFLDEYCNYACEVARSLDFEELFSQAMECLVMERLEGVLDAAELDSLRRIKLLSVLDTYVVQSSYAEFESRVYALSDEALTLDAVNAISLEMAKKYGYYDGESEELYAMGWTEISHFYEAPFYVISYVVSLDGALQLYELERAQPGAGLEKYMALLPFDGVELVEALERAGLESPFSAGRAQAAAALIFADAAAESAA